MNDKIEVIAVHGWAFDRTCWSPWKDMIADIGLFKTYDRGYYGDPREVTFLEESSLKILFAHSYGLHLCPADQLEKANLIVIFGGFTTFHPRAAKFKRRSRMVVRQMIQKFQEHPETVLDSFWKNAFYPEQAPGADFEGYKKSLLMEDLQELDRTMLEIKPMKMADKICILHGSKDGIVSKSKGRELYNQVPEKTTYFEIKEAGHALPFTRPEQCMAFIYPEFKNLRNRLNVR